MVIDLKVTAFWLSLNQSAMPEDSGAQHSDPIIEAAAILIHFYGFQTHFARIKWHFAKVSQDARFHLVWIKTLGEGVPLKRLLLV
jgi:hypothetical protein